MRDRQEGELHAWHCLHEATVTKPPRAAPHHGEDAPASPCHGLPAWAPRWAAKGLIPSRPSEPAAAGQGLALFSAPSVPLGMSRAGDFSRLFRWLEGKARLCSCSALSQAFVVASPLLFALAGNTIIRSRQRGDIEECAVSSLASFLPGVWQLRAHPGKPRSGSSPRVPSHRPTGSTLGWGGVPCALPTNPPPSLKTPPMSWHCWRASPARDKGQVGTER